MRLPEGLSRCRCCGGTFVRAPEGAHYCSPDCRETGPDLMPEDIEDRLREAARTRRRSPWRLTMADCYATRSASAQVVGLAGRLLDLMKGVAVLSVIALDRAGGLAVP